VISPQAFIFGFTQGFVVGPISLFGIREGLDPKGGFWCQLQVLLGATIVDMFYLLLASYGAAEFIDHGLVKLAMWSIAAYMLLSMGYNSFFEKPKRLSIQHVHRHRKKFYETDFFRALLMNMVNPTAIVFWVMVAGSMYATYPEPISPFSFATNILVGSSISASLIVFATLLVRHVFHPWMLRKLIKMGSLVLMAYGLYFSYQAVLVLGPLVMAF
jgi:threonine/homoserine/homoserine lactone efflux protein